MHAVWMSKLILNDGLREAKEVLMERQNVTLSLPKSLLKKAKTLATKEDRSLSELLRETLEERVMQKSGYQRARERQIALMKKGFDMGSKGKVAVTREELHERR